MSTSATPRPSMLQLDPHPHAVPEGRSWVADKARAAGASDDEVFVVELLACELVTNAVKFGPAGGRITVRADRLDEGGLRVVVADDSHLSPTVRHPGPDQEGGRGLLLVDELAQHWGVRLHAGNGKSVWFDLELTAA